MQRCVRERWQRGLVLFEPDVFSPKAHRSVSGASGRVLAQHVWDSAVFGRLESVFESTSVSIVSLGKWGKKDPS